MHIRPRSTALIALLLAVPAEAQSAARSPDTVFPERAAENLAASLVRQSDTGTRGYATFDFDAAEVYAVFDAAHAQGVSTRLAGAPLPGGAAVDLLLAPFSVWEPGASAIVVGEDGSESRVAPGVRLFRLYAPGRAGRGFLGVGPSMVHGYLSLDGETYFYSTGSDAGAPLAVSHAEVFDNAPVQAWCQGVAEDVGEPEAEEPAPARHGEPGALVRTTRIFIEIDKPLRKFFSSDQKAVDYVTLLAGASSDIYRRDLGVRFLIPDGYMRVWNTDGPWEPLEPGFAAINLREWWISEENVLADHPRAMVHGLTRVHNPFTSSKNWGFAYAINALCNDRRGYAVTSLEGSFPYPVKYQSGRNGDLFLFCHESGHVFGSRHTFEYKPEIDCDDGSGPDKGTVMSYCYLEYHLRELGMRFHRRVQDKLRSEVADADCTLDREIRSGDYDVNGVLDPADLAELDAYLEQGFSSRGSEETFDMDGDGTVDAVDRELLEDGLVPPATTIVFNGSGENRQAYSGVTEPILGATWTTSVAYVGSSAPTFVVGSARRLAHPVSTVSGELLIAMSGLGGRTLFSSFAMSDGESAEHTHALPTHPFLAGLELETQAYVETPTGCELLNGLTVRFSTY